MKLVYLYHSLAIWGGVERILVDKMNYLVRHYEYDVYMITSDQGHHGIPYALDERVHFIDLNIRFHQRYKYRWWRRPFIYRQLSQKYHKLLHEQLETILPDVMVCTSIQDAKLLLKVKGRIPLIVESHINFMHPDTLFHRIQTRINNYWLGKAEVVVTLTEGDARDWRQVSNHVQIIPNMVHLNDTNLYSDCTAKRVLFVGRFEEQKNIGELISIWQLVHLKFPDWKLDMYGDGSLWEKYKNEVDALNINIEIHKPTAQIMNVYRNSSIFVLTSLYEPFGLVIPEAMSCGLPVVTFDCPYGPADIITDGVDGFLIRHRSIEDFAEKVCLLMENPELRVKMGKAGIVSSMRYDASKIMPLWKGLFAQLVEK